MCVSTDHDLGLLYLCGVCGVRGVRGCCVTHWQVADTVVGTLENGLSVGERKRFTIGVELVTNPSVLFLGTWSLGEDSGGGGELCFAACLRHHTRPPL